MQRCDLLVLWGTRNKYAIRAQRARHGEICVLERGYLGDRFHWTSVSFGGKLNGRAEFRGLSDDPERFETHFGGMMRPWQRRDGYALLIGQVPGDMSLQPVRGNLNNWYAEAAKQLSERGWEVRFRPHPVAKAHRVVRVPDGVPEIGGTLAEAIAGAGVVVTFNSNTGVESVLAGVPTIACDLGSMAWHVSAQGLDADLVTPDRETWAARLAWTQYSPSEMESGECWERVGSLDYR